MYVKDLSQTKYGLDVNNVPISKNRTWITPDNPDQFYRGGLRSVQIFENLQNERRQKYPDWEQVITEEAQRVASIVQEQGYYRIKNFWDTKFLDKIKKETLAVMEQSDPKKVKYPQDGRHTQVIHPLENIELTNEMATNKFIQAVAAAFLNCPPALGTTNLRLSTAEKSIDAGTNMFHKDFNSPVRLIKFFTYFNDVTMENGPFTYVHGSNRELPANPHWSSQHRWPDTAIETLYGADRVMNLTASYGDLLIATTNGFHKGLKLEEGSRLMLTLNYVIHPELGGSGFAGPAQKLHTVKESTYQNVDESDRHLYDFVEKV